MVYDDEATAEAYLIRRGLTAFQNATAQDVTLIKATSTAENAIRRFFLGVPLDEDQGLLLPAAGAYSSAGTLFDDEPISWIRYRRGIFELGEAIENGSFPLDEPELDRYVVEDEQPGQKLKWSESATRLNRIERSVPEAWSLIRTAYPIWP